MISLFLPADSEAMAKTPDRPKKVKDPAHPTRAKAAREHVPPISPELEQLLNPAIGRGEAGVGSGTGCSCLNIWQNY